MPDTVRVLKIVEYVGPRKWVEETLRRSIHGTMYMSHPTEERPDVPLQMIRTAVLTEYPETLEQQEVETLVEYLARQEAIRMERWRNERA